MIARICDFISTFGPIGYFSAPGTVATILAVPYIYFLQYIASDELVYAGIIAIHLFFSFFIIKQALVYSKRLDDPSEIVIDECIGCMITFWSIPLTTQSLIVGLVVFRFLAILKIGTFREQKSISAMRIILDDIVAAALTNIMLQFLF